MPDLRAQILALRARALHPATPEEESRTSAVLALKLEQKLNASTSTGPKVDDVDGLDERVERELHEALHRRPVEGGLARAKKLTAKRQSAIAQAAATAWWAHLGGDPEDQARRANGQLRPEPVELNADREEPRRVTHAGKHRPTRRSAGSV